MKKEPNLLDEGSDIPRKGEWWLKFRLSVHDNEYKYLRLNGIEYLKKAKFAAVTWHGELQPVEISIIDADGGTHRVISHKW